MPLVTGPYIANIGETIPSGGHILTLENGVVHDSAPAHSMLDVTAKGRVSFDLTESTHALFDRLAQAAGLNVIFDPDFRSLDGQKFKVDNLDILDAMDVLALQTRRRPNHRPFIAAAVSGHPSCVRCERHYTNHV